MSNAAVRSRRIRTEERQADLAAQRQQGGQSQLSGLP